VTFDAPNGTRGARQPRGGPVMRWMTKLMTRRVRRTGRGPGFNALVLTTIGRKTGSRRETPVGWFPGTAGSYLIVASAAGAPKNPAWYLNLAAHPDQVQIETGDGRKVPVTAHQLHGSERDEAWKQITATAPRFAGYERKTDRQMPVIRLVPKPN
jgi:deazaflavin-dependent oxidoreductase (nitroreductase family)